MRELVAEIQPLRGRLDALARQRPGSPSHLVPEVEISAAQIRLRLEPLEAELAELVKADVEEQAAARAAEEAEKERQRPIWRADKQRAETERDTALQALEATLTSALQHARAALDAQVKVDEADAKLGLPRRRLKDEIENRILRRVWDELGAYWIKPGYLLSNEGRAPLADPVVVEAVPAGAARAVAANCSVCVREDRALIERELSEGAPLRQLESRFGVSRSTLSRHVRAHLGRPAREG
jgi:hypothetical protein